MERTISISCAPLEIASFASLGVDISNLQIWNSISSQDFGAGCARTKGKSNDGAWNAGRTFQSVGHLPDIDAIDTARLHDSVLDKIAHG